jgi:hypothetical protein
MTPQERIAKAIYEGRNGAGCKPWAKLTVAHKAPYMADAEAALSVMQPQMSGCIKALEPDLKERMRLYGQVLDKGGGP